MLSIPSFLKFTEEITVKMTPIEDGFSFNLILNGEVVKGSHIYVPYRDLGVQYKDA